MEDATCRTLRPHHTSPAEETRALTAQLKDQIVVVMGGSRGLGKAIAEAFAGHEAQVIAASRTPPDFSEGGRRSPAWMRADVTDVDSVRALERHLRDTHGAVDILINNAATITTAQPILETPVTELLQLVAVNRQGPMVVSRLLVPLMRNRRGMVIEVSSGVARRFGPGLVAYGATKAGLRHFAATFAQELADLEGFAGVRVFCVEPGGMDTPMRDVAYPEETDKSRLADPRRVASFFTRLAAGWITTDVETGQPLRSGQNLVVRRYLPELWPDGGPVSKGEQQDRFSQ